MTRPVATSRFAMRQLVPWRTYSNLGDDPALDDLDGQISDRPVRCGPTAVARRLASYRDDRRDLLGCERRRGSTARIVGQQPGEQLLEFPSDAPWRSASDSRSAASDQRTRHRRIRWRSTPSWRPCSPILTPSAESRTMRLRSTRRCAATRDRAYFSSSSRCFAEIVIFVDVGGMGRSSVTGEIAPL